MLQPLPAPLPLVAPPSPYPPLPPAASRRSAAPVPSAGEAIVRRRDGARERIVEVQPSLGGAEWLAGLAGLSALGTELAQQLQGLELAIDADLGRRITAALAQHRAPRVAPRERRGRAADGVDLDLDLGFDLGFDLDLGPDAAR